jgi:hypothetical protein
MDDRPVDKRLLVSLFLDKSWYVKVIHMLIHCTVTDPMKKLLYQEEVRKKPLVIAGDVLFEAGFICSMQ